MEESYTRFGKENQITPASSTGGRYTVERGENGDQGVQTIPKEFIVSPQRYDEIFLGYEIPTTPTHSIGFTQTQTRKMVAELMSAFTLWGGNETGDSLHVIAGIRKTLQKYIRYLQGNDEARILVGMLESIFSTNQWTELSPDQVQTIARELKRFEAGTIANEQLDTFSNQLHRASIGIV